MGIKKYRTIKLAYVSSDVEIVADGYTFVEQQHKLVSYKNFVIFFLMTFLCIFIPASTSDNTQQRKNLANAAQ